VTSIERTAYPRFKRLITAHELHLLISRGSSWAGAAPPPMLLARSRHASVRSLERYARPGVDAVARHVAERDPAARRKR
jgi:hypothetical protein